MTRAKSSNIVGMESSSAILSAGFPIATTLAMILLFVALLPRRLSASEIADKRIVAVTVALGALLLLGGIRRVRWSVLQSAIPCAVLLGLYGRKLQTRHATADIWPLTLVYPVLPAVLIAAVVAPILTSWLRRRIV